MVDSVGSSTSSAISTLLRSGNTSIAALKSNQEATQAVINQLQKGLEQDKAATNQQNAQSLVKGNSVLPRGSLVDVTV